MNENNSFDSDEVLEEELKPYNLSRRAEHRSFLQLTRELASLPLEQSAAALETSATIASVSLRASIEFLRAAPAAAGVLEAPELRSWGEMGRRIAMSDVETAIIFFSEGVSGLQDIPKNVHPSVFQLCSRQVTLSTSIAIDTLRNVSALAKSISSPVALAAVLDVASEISRRSAKHSAEFLNKASEVVGCLSRFKSLNVMNKGIELAAEFASRAGGIAADAWAALPSALASLNSHAALNLLDNTIGFLERGGGSALQVLVTGGEILRTLPEIFHDWLKLLWTVAQHGNASLVAFVRSSPRFVRGLASEADHDRKVELAERVIVLTRAIAEVDGEAALACFRSSTLALRTVSISQFEEWALRGLTANNKDARARRSYFALETRGSYDALRSGSKGLSLEGVRHLLTLYIEGLTSQEVDISPLAAVPVESRIGDGRTIHLPSVVAEFGDDELDFRLYKVLAAHAAGQIEFGTSERGTPTLRAAYSALNETYNPANVAARDAFAVPDEMVEVGQTFLSVNSSGRQASPSDLVTDRNVCPADVDYRQVLHLFPNPQLARRIFGTLENCRIDRRLRQNYRGLARDLDLIREHLRRGRPSITELPATLVPFELLFQTTLLGGAADDARQYYGQIVSELEIVAAQYFSSPSATVADSLMATSQVYSLFQSMAPADDSVKEIETQEEPSETEEENSIATESFNRRPSDRTPRRRDVRELFNAWNDPDGEGEPDELAGAEAWTEAELPEQMIEEGEVAYNYDEWDRELTDYRIGWCRVVEKRVKHGDRVFVEQTRERHKGVISSIRHQFQLMKPEDLLRVTNELDGEEFDLNAVIDYVIDRRADGHQSERLYTRRLRRQRDVAVSFLLDQSSSTARTIGRHPLQPYTRPGRRIIEIEKEGLVLMSEALEAVGDVYSINGFTSEGRRNVKFYVVKDFDEKYSDEVKQRIGGITFQNNTRLGAAIRHATARLAKQEARTRLLIVLSDGRPYDHDYGDARYAREDTREALRQAKNQGITPFCITIDRESEAELRDLYGEIGYTIIDDVLSLPERLPGIYRRLTT